MKSVRDRRGVRERGRTRAAFIFPDELHLLLRILCLKLFTKLLTTELFRPLSGLCGTDEDTCNKLGHS